MRINKDSGNCEEHTNFQSRDELRQSNEEKIKVEEELELFIEHNWKKGECVVLLISHNVRGIPQPDLLCSTKLTNFSVFV